MLISDIFSHHRHMWSQVWPWLCLKKKKTPLVAGLLKYKCTYRANPWFFIAGRGRLKIETRICWINSLQHQKKKLMSYWGWILQKYCLYEYLLQLISRLYTPWEWLFQWGSCKLSPLWRSRGVLEWGQTNVWSYFRLTTEWKANYFLQLLKNLDSLESHPSLRIVLKASIDSTILLSSDSRLYFT